MGLVFYAFKRENPMLEFKISVQKFQKENNVIVEMCPEKLFCDKVSLTVSELCFGLDSNNLVYIICACNINVFENDKVEDEEFDFEFKLLSNGGFNLVPNTSFDLTKNNQFYDKEIFRLFNNIKFIAKIQWYQSLPFVSDSIQGAHLEVKE
jgi:hypothetical protein